MQDVFSGIWVPLVTPFARDGRVDTARLAAIARHLAFAGIHGFVVCGTTGEPAALDDHEKAKVLATVAAAGPGIPLVMGVGGAVPRDEAAQCRRWSDAHDLAGFLLAPPAYVRPSQQGIVDFFAGVAATAARPLVVYDIPYRTGVAMDLSTLRTIAQLPGVGALKDCGGDPSKTQALIADGRLAVLAGEDAHIFTTLCQGGRGAIAASAHLHPRAFVALFEAVTAGRWLEARRLHHGLAPMVAATFAEPNPGPLKGMLARLGQLEPVLRAPMTAAGPVALQTLQAAYTSASELVAS